MGVDFGRVFSSALSYAFGLKRLLPFFVLNLAMVAFALVFINSIVDIAPLLISGGASAAPWLNIAGAVLSLLILMVVISLVRIFYQGVITDNARAYWQKKNVKLSKSYPIAKKKYITILLALILSGVISFFVSFVFAFAGTVGAFLSLVASFILSLIFLFLIQIIIISNKGVLDSIREGYRLFTKNILDVFVFWLILMVLSLLIVVVALIPVFVALIPVIAPLVESASGSVTYGAEFAGEIISAVKSNMLGLGIAGVISALIIAYMQAFQEAAKTFFYMQKKKR